VLRKFGCFIFEVNAQKYFRIDFKQLHYLYIEYFEKYFILK